MRSPTSHGESAVRAVLLASNRFVGTLLQIVGKSRSERQRRIIRNRSLQRASESISARNTKAMGEIPKMLPSPARSLQDRLPATRPVDFQDERAVEMQIVEGCAGCLSGLRRCSDVIRRLADMIPGASFVVWVMELERDQPSKVGFTSGFASRSVTVLANSLIPRTILL
jgi:hypothetical protein